MAAAVLPKSSLQHFRVFLLVLIIVTVFLVFVLYGATSGVITANKFRSVTNKPRLAATRHTSKVQPKVVINSDRVITLTPAIGENLTNSTSVQDGKKPRSKIEYFDLTDYRKIDISESIKCDDQCQRNVQRLRQRGISQTCAMRRRPSIWDAEGNLRASQLSRLSHLFPIDGSKMIYCSVPKDGCSAWKRILLKVAGYDPDHFPGNIHPPFAAKMKPLSKYSVTEAQRRLQTYNKFLFVREPMNRMLSLFLDKSVDKNDFPFDNTQFEDFLRYMLKKPVRGRAMGYSEHWTHASYLCLPCDVNYTFIGRLETSKRDSSYVFDHFVNPSVGELSMPTKIHKTHSSNPEIKSLYFSRVNRTILQQIYDRYSLDYKMFSYSRPRILKTNTIENYKDKLR